jgi:hypothetical protein
MTIATGGTHFVIVSAANASRVWHGHDAEHRANENLWEHRIYRDQKRPVLLEWVKHVIVKYVQV